MNDWIKTNLYWILPMVVTAILTICNILILVINAKQTKLSVALQKDKFCYELMAQRVEIFHLMDYTLLQASAGDEKDKPSVLREYRMRAKSLPFLFGEDIQLLHREIETKLQRLYVITQHITRNIERQKPSENHSDLCNEEHEIIAWLTHERDALAPKFYPYIDFSQYTLSNQQGGTR